MMNLLNMMGGIKLSPGMVKMMLCQVTDDEGAMLMVDELLAGDLTNVRIAPVPCLEGQQRLLVLADKPESEVSIEVICRQRPKKTLDGGTQP